MTPVRAAAAILIAALAGVAAADAPLRVVGFNLYHGGVTSVRWGDGDLLEQRVLMVSTQLAQIGADVVGVQEASVGGDRGDVAGRIAAELGFRRVWAAAGWRWAPWLARTALGFEEGPAVLSRFPIVSSDATPLAACGLAYRRMVVCARVAAPAGPVDVCSAHTSASRCEHRSLVAVLRRRYASVPLVLLGDLNAGPDARGIRALVRKLGLVDAFATANPGAPGFTVRQSPRESRPTASRRVDYVLVRPAQVGTLRVAASWIVLRTPDRGPDLRMLWPSDHYGVLADLVFGPGA
jgi:endonuclease/exonuclease/phosphatase family metal-dependent hydrolase